MGDIIELPNVKGTRIQECKLIRPHERLQALVMAIANEERAALCSPDQPALREFLLQNAALLRSFAE